VYFRPLKRVSASIVELREEFERLTGYELPHGLVTFIPSSIKKQCIENVKCALYGAEIMASYCAIITLGLLENPSSMRKPLQSSLKH